MESSRDRSRFARFVDWFAPIALIFGLGVFLGALVFRSSGLAAAGVVTLLYGGCLKLAQRLLKRDRLEAAVGLTGGGLLVGTLLAAPFVPQAIPALKFLPMVVVALALPYLSGRLLRWIILAAGATGAATAVIQVLLPVQSAPPDGFAAVFKALSTTIAIGMASLLLWQYSKRIDEAAAAALEERHKREESEERFRSLFLHVPVSVWEMDFSAVGEALRAIGSAGVKDFKTYFTDHPEEVLRLAALVRVLEVNDRTLALYEAPDTEAIQEKLSTIFSLYSYLVFKDILTALAAGVTKFESETVLRTLNGGTCNVILRINIPPGFEHSLSRALISTLDITARKRSEERLRQSTKRAEALSELSRRAVAAGYDYRTLLESVTEMVSEIVGEGCVIRLLSEDGRWLQAEAAYHPDPKIRRMFESNAGAGRLPVSPGWEARLAAPDRDLDLGGAFSEDLKSGSASHIKTRFDAIGSQVATIALLRNQEHIQGTLGVFRTRSETPYSEADRAFLQEVADRLALVITNIRLYQEEQRMNVELEQRVSMRTAQLEASNKELESFTYSVSHDLRGPLRHTVGYIELFQRHVNGFLDEKGTRYLNIISSEAVRMGELIDDLLEFSRIGHREMDETTVSIDALVRDVVRELEPETEGRTIDWQIDPLPDVLGDRAMLRQVWINLLANALKYTRTRTRAEISVGCTPTEDGGVFFVRDNGVGFDMKYSDKLFGIFQRLHAIEEFEGTGIGLANVQRVVHRHGGQVWAEAEEDAGAAFFFTLHTGNGK